MFVLALKANHPTLHSQVKNWFDQAQAHNFEGIKFSYDYRLEKGHHRLEKRWCWAVPLEAFGGLYQQQQWLGLKKNSCKLIICYNDGLTNFPQKIS